MVQFWKKCGVNQFMPHWFIWTSTAWTGSPRTEPALPYKIIIYLFFGFLGSFSAIYGSIGSGRGEPVHAVIREWIYLIFFSRPLFFAKEFCFKFIESVLVLFLTTCLLAVLMTGKGLFLCIAVTCLKPVQYGVNRFTPKLKIINYFFLANKGKILRNYERNRFMPYWFIWWYFDWY